MAKGKFAALSERGDEHIVPLLTSQAKGPVKHGLDEARRIANVEARNKIRVRSFGYLLELVAFVQADRRQDAAYRKSIESMREAINVITTAQTKRSELDTKATSTREALVPLLAALEAAREALKEPQKQLAATEAEITELKKGIKKRGYALERAATTVKAMRSEYNKRIEETKRYHRKWTGREPKIDEEEEEEELKIDERVKQLFDVDTDEKQE